MKQFNLNIDRENVDFLLKSFKIFERNIKKHFKLPVVLKGNSQEMVNKIHLNIEQNLPFSSSIKGKILF